MTSLGSIVLRLAIVLLALPSLASCSRGCSSGSDGAPSVALAPSGPTARPAAGAPVARTSRLDGAKSTEDILEKLGPDCLSCAKKNGCLDPAQQGAVCETPAGVSKVTGESESAICLDALRCIFTTQCASTGEESQCLCGATEFIACSEGKSPPSGACVSAFKKDFGDDNKKMYDAFIDPQYGVGRANRLIQCAVPLCPSCRVR